MEGFLVGLLLSVPIYRLVIDPLFVVFERPSRGRWE